MLVFIISRLNLLSSFATLKKSRGGGGNAHPLDFSRMAETKLFHYP